MSLADQACGNGLAALRDGDLDLAEAHFQEALQKKFDHPKTRYFYGLMLQNQRRDPARAEALWRAVSMFQLKSRFHVQLLCNLAALLIEYKQDFEEAEKCYKLALDCDPGHVNAMVNYAEQLLNKAIRTNPAKIHNGGYLLQELILSRKSSHVSERAASPSSSANLQAPSSSDPSNRLTLQ